MFVYSGNKTNIPISNIILYCLLYFYLNNEYTFSYKKLLFFL